ncbi:MAG: hypothetical protein NTW03_02580, partial [Verrucomicrobia bacterium]|nr:hypothetical protein [Verrucomicrobiota bacterium]
MKFSGITGQVEVLLCVGKDEQGNEIYEQDESGDDRWRLAKMDTVLTTGSRIKTDFDAAAILSFSDMSTFVLRGDAEVVLNGPPEKESKLRLVAGNIWKNVKQIIKDGTMEQEMNQ